MTGHTKNNCVHFRHLIQKAIKEGRLKFMEKETMKVNPNPVEVSTSFAKPVFISTNVAGVEADHVANTRKMSWLTNRNSTTSC